MTTNRAEAWQYKLRCLQLELDHLILATPTGTVRDILCDVNIQLDTVQALDNPYKKEGEAG